MPWDVALDLKTGDWKFAVNRDIEGVDDQFLDRQRISIRLRVPRGGFHYIPQLGSLLHEMLRYTEPRAMREIPTIVQSALERMFDISILEVKVVPASENPEGVMSVIVSYRPLAEEGLALAQLVEPLSSIITTSFEIPPLP